MSRSEQLPLRAEELTTEWLRETMKPYTRGSAISGFESSIIGVGEGFMGQLARVMLQYEHETDAPRSIIAKFAALKPETREFAREQNLYQREIGFYRDIGADVGVPVPECYFAVHVEETNHFVILLEDLAPGEPSDQVIGADKATSRQVIEHFAKLHAKWWNSDRLEEYGWAKWFVDEMPMDQGLELLQQSFREAEETGKFDAYPEMKRLMYLLPPLFRVEPQPPFPFSLTHGDLRSDNIIMPTEAGGRFAVIDWQLCGKGDPVNDIARWLVQSISIEDRRETEQELLKLYHSKLLEHGVKGYSYRAFINNYKINLVVVLLMFSMSMENVDQTPERAKALFHQFYSRLDAALVDWEIEKLLKVLPYMVPFLNFSNWLKAKLKRIRG